MRTKLPRLSHEFFSNTSGGVAVYFSLSLTVLLGITGMMIDYGDMLRLKGRLDTAADAGALAGVLKANSTFSAYTGTGDPTATAIAAGEAEASNKFYGSEGALPPGTLTLTPPSITRSGTTLTDTVSYSFTPTSLLMPAFSGSKMSISGTRTASVTRPTYVNIIIVIDNSESMGIGATSTDQNTIFAHNGGCALACHYKGQDSATPMRALGATLRIDAEKAAVYSALSTLQSGTTYQVAIYSLSSQLEQVYALSNDITGAMKMLAPISQNASSLDLAADANNGGTDTTNCLKQLTTILTGLKTSGGAAISAGDGLTPTTAKGIVMLITDAVQNSDLKDINGNNITNNTFTYNSPCAAPTCYAYAAGGYMQSVSSSDCTPIKTLGYTLMTLDTTYLIPPLSEQYDSFYEGAFAAVQNYLLSQNATAMSACATSSTYAFSGSTPADLSNAVTAMFAAIPKQTNVHLTQ